MDSDQQKKWVGVALVAGSFVLIAAIVAYLHVDSQTFVSPARQDGRMSVVTSFYPLEFFATRIGGNFVTVTNITPAGAEPHDYEPGARDVAAMEDSRLVVLLGGLEPWGSRVTRNLDARRTTVIQVGSGMQTLGTQEDGETVMDPHIWLSPPIARSMVEKMATAFAGADPVHANDYAENAVALQSDLDALDARFHTGLAGCAKKNFVTSHAAFAYLAAAYDLRQESIAGLSPDAEPSPRELADITTFARDHAVGTIFFESLVSPKLAQTVAQEIGARTAVLNPLEGLTEDERAAGANYLTVMGDNLNALKEALQCPT